MNGFVMTAVPRTDGTWEVKLERGDDPQLHVYLSVDKPLKDAILEVLAYYEPLLAVELGADAKVVLEQALYRRAHGWR